MKSEADFELVRLEVERFYSSVGSVMCPYFNGAVVFNAKGMEHLKFKTRDKSRSRQDLYPRLKLLHRVPEVLKLSRTVQGIFRTRCFEEQKVNNRWERILKDVTFYEFIAVVDDIRIKVVVKEISGGVKHFLSVIPFWRFHRATGNRIIHDQRLKDEIVD